MTYKSNNHQYQPCSLCKDLTDHASGTCKKCRTVECSCCGIIFKIRVKPLKNNKCSNCKNKQMKIVKSFENSFSTI